MISAEITGVYIKLLLYDDDTVILDDSMDELQQSLYAMESYYSQNNLKVN